MEARTGYFNFMGQKWTVETNSDFSFSEKCPVPAVVATQQGKETEFYLTITKPSLDENEKKEMTFLGFWPKISLYFVENSLKKGKFNRS